MMKRLFNSRVRHTTVLVQSERISVLVICMACSWRGSYSWQKVKDSKEQPDHSPRVCPDCGGDVYKR